MDAKLSSDDFLEAIKFYDTAGKDMLLQVPSKYCVPQVIRMLVAKLGVPSRSLYSTLYYGKFKFHIFPVQDVRISTLGDIDTFYIGYEDGSDLNSYQRVEYDPILLGG